MQTLNSHLRPHNQHYFLQSWTNPHRWPEVSQYLREQQGARGKKLCYLATLGSWLSHAAPHPDGLQNSRVHQQNSCALGHIGAALLSVFSWKRSRPQQLGAGEFYKLRTGAAQMTLLREPPVSRNWAAWSLSTNWSQVGPEENQHI